MSRKKSVKRMSLRQAYKAAGSLSRKYRKKAATKAASSRADDVVRSAPVAPKPNA